MSNKEQLFLYVNSVYVVIICVAVYEPVCSIKGGGKGVTYGNSCLLGAAGDTLDHEGDC